MNWKDGTLSVCKKIARDKYKDGCMVRLERILPIPFTTRTIPIKDTFRTYWQYPDMVGTQIEWDGWGSPVLA